MKTRRFYSIISAAMVLALLCAGVLSLSASAEEEKGSIQVNVAPFAEELHLALYRVGVYENGEYKLDDTYASCGADLNDVSDASKAQEAADLLAACSENDTEVQNAWVDKNGIANFTDVPAENVIYIIRQINMEDIIKVGTILLSLPRYADDGSTEKNLVIDAKFTDLRADEPKSAIILNKTGKDGVRLQGATFAFEQKTYIVDGEIEGTPVEEILAEEGNEILQDEVGKYYWQHVAEFVTNENGQIVVQSVPFGTYRFIEIKAPKGYVLDSTPVEAVLESEGTVRLENKLYVVDEGGVAVLNVVNKPEEESSKPSVPSIPSTPNPPVITGENAAGYGIVMIVIAASLIVMVFVTRKGKKRDTE